MTGNHPITPPPKLVQQWYDAARGPRCEQELATQAARWGANQELEACVEWINIHLHSGPYLSKQLRAARRPKQPSLKEQALETLSRISKDEYPCSYQDDKDWKTIRRALEQLDD